MPLNVDQPPNQKFPLRQYNLQRTKSHTAKIKSQQFSQSTRKIIYRLYLSREGRTKSTRKQKN